VGLCFAPEGRAADTFLLKYEKTGRTFGPFEFRDGEVIPMGNASFTLILAETDEPPGHEFDLLGYDGIPFGSDRANVLEQLKDLPGIELDKDGLPALKEVSGNVYQYVVYRSRTGKTDKSKVKIRFEDGKAVLFENIFDGAWRWDAADTARIFKQLTEQIIGQWGQPTKQEDDSMMWASDSGQAVLQLERPANKYELPIIKLTISSEPLE